MPSDGLKAVFMHISDLHFGEDLDRTKKTQKVKQKIQEFFRKKILPSFIPPLIPEDRVICDRLAILVDDINKERRIDYLIVSGDLTAIGDIASFENVKKFLGNPFDAQIPGLSFEEGRLLLVPGNHDTISNKYGFFGNPGNRLENYYQVFQRKLPYLVGPVDLKGKKFTFFCFDSTSPEFVSFSDGEIGDKEISWFYRETKKLKKRYGTDYIESTKIVIFHHHPIPLPGTRPNIWTQLIDGSRFLPLLNEEGIDLVLHGHEHLNAISKIEYVFSNTKKKPVTICAAGTASRDKSNENTFNMYYFYQKKAFLETWKYEKDVLIFKPKPKIRLF
ncbi:MAG: metallophosphoesterase [Syntrophales bacterium]